jgi:hypothetical protein
VSVFFLLTSCVHHQCDGAGVRVHDGRGADGGDGPQGSAHQPGEKAAVFVWVPRVKKAAVFFPPNKSGHIMMHPHGTIAAGFFLFGCTGSE